MLITLPKSEAQQCITVWHGAQWRMYDYVPPPDLRLPDYSHLTRADRLHRYPTRGMLQAWLTDDLRTADQAAIDLGIQPRAARQILRALALDGKAERDFSISPRRRRVVRYRRAR